MVAVLLAAFQALKSVRWRSTRYLDHCPVRGPPTLTDSRGLGFKTTFVNGWPSAPTTILERHFELLLSFLSYIAYDSIASEFCTPMRLPAHYQIGRAHV